MLNPVVLAKYVPDRSHMTPPHDKSRTAGGSLLLGSLRTQDPCQDTLVFSPFATEQSKGRKEGLELEGVGLD
ncbi:unnamed protein product [Gadus morhua 'NCC']